MILDDVADAARRIRDRMEKAGVSRAKLYAKIRLDHAEGIPAAAISRASGLSRERIRQIVAEKT